MENIIGTLLAILAIYLAIGFVFGLLFVLFGVKRIDHGAEAGTWGFRILILPGCAIFWPYLLLCWAKGSQPSEEKSAHRTAAKS